jgi:hypothetical protein
LRSLPVVIAGPAIAQEAGTTAKLNTTPSTIISAIIDTDSEFLLMKIDGWINYSIKRKNSGFTLYELEHFYGRIAP